MDGRIKLPLVILLLSLGVFATPAARGQAMVKAAVEGSATAPASEVPKSEPARLPVIPGSTLLAATAPALPAPVAPTASNAPESPAKAAAAPETLASTAPAPDPKIPAPIAAATQPEPAPESIDDTFIHSGKNTPAAAPGTAEKKSPASPSGFAGLAQTGAALAVVLGLIFIGKALARKFIPGAKAASGKGVIEILARHPLAKNQSIVLVRIGSQIVALNQRRDSSESVLVISDQTEVASIIGQIEGKKSDSPSAGFNRMLANARMDLEETPEEETDLKSMDPDNLDSQLEEMAAAKRQLMELRQHVRSVRDRLPQD